MRNRLARLIGGLLLFVAVSASAQNMVHYVGQVLKDTGRPAAGATVTVGTDASTGTPLTPLATIYVDQAGASSSGTTTMGTAIALSVATADSRGNFDFYAAGDQEIKLQAACSGCTTMTIADVKLDSPHPWKSVDQFTGGSVTAKIDACLAALTTGTCVVPASIGAGNATSIAAGKAVLDFRSGFPKWFTNGSVSVPAWQLDDLGNVITRGRRVIVGGVAPTCTFTSGGGTSPSCSLQTGSTDEAGVLIATTGTGSPGSSGDITLTFSSSYGTNAPSCQWTQSLAGVGQWNARATSMDKTPATGSDLMHWDNNAVALSLSTAYHLSYHCTGK